MATPRAGSAAAGTTVSTEALTHNPRGRRVKLTVTHRF